MSEGLPSGCKYINSNSGAYRCGNNEVGYASQGNYDYISIVIGIAAVAFIIIAFWRINVNRKKNEAVQGTDPTKKEPIKEQVRPNKLEPPAKPAEPIRDKTEPSKEKASGAAIPLKNPLTMRKFDTKEEQQREKTAKETKVAPEVFDVDDTKGVFKWYFSNPSKVALKLLVFLWFWAYLMLVVYAIVVLFLGLFIAHPILTLVIGIPGGLIPIYVIWFLFKQVPVTWTDSENSMKSFWITALYMFIALAINFGVYSLSDLVINWLT